MRTVLVDLFCGAGGATRGYQEAGFYVIGVDIEPQPHYCGDEFVRMNALEFLDDPDNMAISGAVAVHASPPCQGYSRMNHVHKRQYPMLIEPTRQRLIASGLPYVIENVEGAPLIDPIMLCGTMFGLKVKRHRLFESTLAMPQLPCASHQGEFYSPAGHGDPNWRNRQRNPHLSGCGYTQRCREAMGIDWMNRDELAESIPPAYTRWVGRQLMAHLNASPARRAPSALPRVARL